MLFILEVAQIHNNCDLCGNALPLSDHNLAVVRGLEYLRDPASSRVGLPRAGLVKG